MSCLSLFLYYIQLLLLSSAAEFNRWLSQVRYMVIKKKLVELKMKLFCGWGWVVAWRNVGRRHSEEDSEWVGSSDESWKMVWTFEPEGRERRHAGAMTKTSAAGQEMPGAEENYFSSQKAMHLILMQQRKISPTGWKCSDFTSDGRKSDTQMMRKLLRCLFVSSQRQCRDILSNCN